MHNRRSTHGIISYPVGCGEVGGTWPANRVSCFLAARLWRRMDGTGLNFAPRLFGSAQEKREADARICTINDGWICAGHGGRGRLRRARDLRRQ
ncbi:hypothetical protein SBA5_100096 [Candidatus Sulfotelmatomonas gaucii]|uniref:Uncharacterized protein n=1 Tax=Candidatus Sulfuritelmatomonas gaucii TaxID=2043161 RepID=A0A2N9L2I2_9BACT|nr:hypothetical protein SBA5_100096 [Candidatus Sulfotelmatomonas gaucii]